MMTRHHPAILPRRLAIPRSRHGRDAAASRRGRLVVAAFALVLASVFVTGAAAAGKAPVTVYSVATGVQYINTADDRERGQSNNPFDDATKKLFPKNSGTGNGPFAGDVALYALSLFGDAALKKRAGSAVITCYFNYDQHAFCQAYYKLSSGATLVASGPVDFKDSGFTIVLTGGTNAYIGVRGEVRVAPAPNKAQRVDFELIG